MPMKSSRTREGIIAGGNFITDYIKLIDAWPEQDTLASIRSESLCNGGGPYNLLKDISKLRPEMHREACGLVGEDLNGDWMLQDCLAASIDVSQLHRTHQAATSYTDAMTVTSTGRRTFFHQRGANALLAPEHFRFDQTPAKIFMLGYLMLLDTLDSVDAEGVTGATKVLRSARQSGLLTAVDCVSEPNSRFQDVTLSALDETDIFFANEFEIGQVLGREVPAEREALIQAASQLSQQCSRESTQIVLHTTHGSVVAQRDGTQAFQASVELPTNQIAGANGAGDAFAAGYLLGVHDDQETAECLRYAVCAAAMSLTDPTPSNGMKSLNECLELADRYGFKRF